MDSKGRRVATLHLRHAHRDPQQGKLHPAPDRGIGAAYRQDRGSHTSLSGARSPVAGGCTPEAGGCTPEAGSSSRKRGPMTLIEESHQLRAALRACRDRSALLFLKSAATIFRSRMIIEQARDRLASARSWREHHLRRGVMRHTVLPTSSATRSAPAASTATPTGRPIALPCVSTKPERITSGSPEGRPLAKGTKTTL